MSLSKKRLPINEIFLSIQGEGISAGIPTVFIRFQGCNLNCSWCDTRYAQSLLSIDEFDWLSIDDILARVLDFSPVRSVCITGGEPLLYLNELKELLRELIKYEHIQDMQIETNGSFDITFLTRLPKVRVIMDIKLHNSMEFEKMHLNNIPKLRKIDELKFVVYDSKDFQQALVIIKGIKIEACILFSPVINSLDPQELVQLMLENKVFHARLSLQIHKFIWKQEQRGV